MPIKTNFIALYCIDSKSNQSSHSTPGSLFVADRLQGTSQKYLVTPYTYATEVHPHSIFTVWTSRNSTILKQNWSGDRCKIEF